MLQNGFLVLLMLSFSLVFARDLPAHQTEPNARKWLSDVTLNDSSSAPGPGTNDVPISSSFSIGVIVTVLVAFTVFIYFVNTRKHDAVEIDSSVEDLLSDDDQ